MFFRLAFTFASVRDFHVLGVRKWGGLSSVWHRVVVFFFSFYGFLWYFCMCATSEFDAIPRYSVNCVLCGVYWKGTRLQTEFAWTTSPPEKRKNMSQTNTLHYMFEFGYNPRGHILYSDGLCVPNELKNGKTPSLDAHNRRCAYLYFPYMCSKYYIRVIS